jgi:thymidylate kinase
VLRRSHKTLFTVALIGPDGSGKTTISKRLETELGLPIASIYMGVNMYSSGVMAPHMRLIRFLRRRMHGDDPNLRSDIRDDRPEPKPAVLRPIAAIREGLRLASWLAEESYRLFVARRHTRHGRIVVFDRHFFADFYAEDVGAPAASSRPVARRIRLFVLRHVYPRPDLTIYLDAPAEVVYARKPEGTIERLRQRREAYLALLPALPEHVVVDASLPADDVVNEVAAAIRAFHKRRLEESLPPHARSWPRRRLRI